MTVAFPTWLGAKAEVSIHRTEEQADVVVELFKGDQKLGDLAIGINYQGEFVLRVTEDGMRSSDEHQATIYPERAMDGSRGDFIDGFRVMLLPARSLHSAAAR